MAKKSNNAPKSNAAPKLSAAEMEMFRQWQEQKAQEAERAARREEMLKRQAEYAALQPDAAKSAELWSKAKPWDSIQVWLPMDGYRSGIVCDRQTETYRKGVNKGQVAREYLEVLVCPGVVDTASGSDELAFICEIAKDQVVNLGKQVECPVFATAAKNGKAKAKARK